MKGGGNMADAVTENGSVTVDSESASNIELEKQKALETLTKSARDLLTVKIKIPGGNPILKKLHTNSFIWTELPERFNLSNLKTVGKAMSSEYTRYSGYELNRWYVENLTITCDSSGLWFEADVNPFASSYSSYANILKIAQDAFTNANQQNTVDGATTTSTGGGVSTSGSIALRTDGVTDCSTSMQIACNTSWANIKTQQNKVESEKAKGGIGRAGTNYANYIDSLGLKNNPKGAYKALCKLWNYTRYYDNGQKCAEQTFARIKSGGRINCGDSARLLKAVMDYCGQPCVIYCVPGHYMNGVYLNGRWETVDLCYQSGVHPEYQTAGWNK